MNPTHRTHGAPHILGTKPDSPALFGTQYRPLDGPSLQKASVRVPSLEKGVLEALWGSNRAHDNLITPARLSLVNRLIGALEQGFRRIHIAIGAGKANRNGDGKGFAL